MTPENRVEAFGFQVFPVIWMNPAVHLDSLFHGYFLSMTKQNTRMDLGARSDSVLLGKQLVDVYTHAVLIDQHSEVGIYTHIQGLPR